MSYRPQRTFNGTQGNPSTDTMGPEQLSHDIDELCKMFNPTSIHSDGSVGGVTADNLNFTGLDINEIGGVASGDIKAIRVKMNGDIEYTTDGETYHPAFAREANYLPLAGGTMSGTLNMNNNKITNLATPEVGSDPATKNYTDAIRTALEVALALKAPIDSPTFTGTPTAPTPSTEDSSTQIATTAFTQAVAAGVAGNTYSKADADAKFETIANANKLVKKVSYSSATGTFTIVTQDGTTTTIDTNIEKIPVSVSIIQSGSTYKLRITNEDGSYSECDVSAMFNAITFVDSAEIDFTETTNQDGSKNVTASIKPGSIVGSKLDPDYKDILDALVDRAETAETNAQNSADNAADSATAAANSASAASGSATAAAGSVTSASQYATAAEGFKNQASNSATAAASSATEAATSASNASTSETNAAASASSAATSASNAATSASDAASDAQRTQELTNEAMEYATDAAGSQIDAETAARNAAASASTASTKASQAATSASNASASETNAANSASAAAASAASVGTQASDAEAAARGTRNGVPVSSTDEFYNDNAKYYKDQAAAIVGPQQPKITATGILKGEGDGVVSAAVAGTDYQAPLPSQSGQSGKFLTTNGSALSWADNPPELFRVRVFYDYEQEKYVANKTCAEIESAYNEGKLPCAIYRNAIHYFAGCDNIDHVIYISFLGIANADGRASFISMDSVGGVHEPENVRLAPLDSPDFTGTPTTPDLTSTSDGTQIANKNYVDNHTPDLSGYMQKGVDYVTAGQMSGTILGTKATAEGNYTTATANYSHAEGDSTTASGIDSHAEGLRTKASGSYSHAEGSNTTAQRRSQHVFGEFNVLDATGSNTSRKGSYVEIVGNGTSSARSNARTLDWSGNETLAGKLTLGAGPTANMDAATKQYVDSKEVPPEIFWVHLTDTYDSQTDTHTYTADKTISDIYTASESGMLPIVTMGINFYILSFRYADNATMQMYFARPLINSALAHCTAVSTRGVDQWTVSSVNLVDSPSLTGTPTAPTPTSSSAATQIATKEYVDAEVDGVLPSQSGQGGKFLTTNGTTASWADAKELFLVTFTVDSNNIYSADHTMSEIAAAASAGKIVRGVFNDGSNGNLYFNNVKSYLFATINYNHSGQRNASFIMLYGEYDGTSEFWMRHEKELTLTTYTNIFVPSMTVVTIPYDDLETAYYSGSVVRTLAPKSDGSYEYYVAESCSYRADASATGTMIFSNSNGKLILTYDPNGGTYEADKQSWQFISAVGAFIAIVNTTTYNELVNALATNVPIFAYAVGSTTKDLYRLVYFSGSAFIFTQPYYNSASSNGPALFSYSIDSTNTWTAMNTYLAPGKHNHAASNITSGTLSVARGGTGAATLTSGAVLIGNGTSAIATRSITNNTSSTALAANTNIPTMNTVKYGLDNRLNRTTAVNAADTGYTTYMTRGEALNSADTNPTVNGAISWTYA